MAIQAAVSPKWHNRGRGLLLITNRKSHMRFRLVPNQRTWLTPKAWTAIMRSIITYYIIFVQSPTRKFEDIDPYYQQ